MADGLSIGTLSVSGGLARLTGTSSKLDTEADRRRRLRGQAAAGRAARAADLAQRCPQRRARRAEDPPAEPQGRRRGPAQPAGPAGCERQRVRDQAGLPHRRRRGAGRGSGRRQRREPRGGRRLLARGRPAWPTAHKLAAQPLGAAGQTLADAWNGGAAFAGTLGDRPRRRRQGGDRGRWRHVRGRSARRDQCGIARRPASRPACSRSPPPIGAWS